MVNGATGFIGIPFDDGWELVTLAYTADQYAATASIRIDLMNYNNPSNAVTNTIASISLANSSDGFGGTDNAAKIVAFDPPVPIPGPFIAGFITRTVVGAIIDHRVYARFRRQIGEYVSNVGLNT